MVGCSPLISACSFQDYIMGKGRNDHFNESHFFLDANPKSATKTKHGPVKKGSETGRKDKSYEKINCVIQKIHACYSCGQMHNFFTRILKSRMMELSLKTERNHV